MLLRKAQVGAIKQEGDRTYQLNQNYRWERVNRNIGRTVRKLERQRNVDKLRWIGDRIENNADDDAMFDPAYSAAMRLEESQFARDLVSQHPNAFNPKRLRKLLEAEIAKPNPKIGVLRRISKIASEGADAIEPTNDKMAWSLNIIAQDANDEAELRQEAKELKRNKDADYKLTEDGRLLSHSWGDFNLAGYGSFSMDIVVAQPPLTPDNTADWKEQLLKRYNTEKDHWMKQAIIKDIMRSPPVGTVKREYFSDKGAKFYRFTELGNSYAYQQISESELTPEERQLLSGQ